MWFKNLTVFQLAGTLPVNTPEELHDHMSQSPFTPCPAFQTQSLGWEAPIGHDGAPLVHVTHGCWLVCLRIDDKIMPAGVIKELLNKKIKEMEAKTGQKVGQGEKQALKESIEQQILPKALCRTRRLYAYIDTVRNWLIVDSTSANAITVLTGLLRENIGSLPITPLEIAQSPSFTMTQWVAHGSPAIDLVIGAECDLIDPEENGAVVRCRRQDLATDEIASHLEAGKIVSKLLLHWQDKLDFILSDNLTFSRFRASAVLKESLESQETETREDEFDAQFALLTGEIREMLPELLSLLDTTTRSNSLDQAA